MCGTGVETWAEGTQEWEDVMTEPRAFPGHDLEVGRMLWEPCLCSVSCFCGHQSAIAILDTHLETKFSNFIDLWLLKREKAPFFSSHLRGSTLSSDAQWNRWMWGGPMCSWAVRLSLDPSEHWCERRWEQRDQYNGHHDPGGIGPEGIWGHAHAEKMCAFS